MYVCVCVCVCVYDVCMCVCVCVCVVCVCVCVCGVCVCVCVCVYVCMYDVSFYVWVMSHQWDWSYYTDLQSTNEIARSKGTLLKVNQGDLSRPYVIWVKRLLTEKLGSFLSIVRQKYVFCL